jgi:hypothetical protein
MRRLIFEVNRCIFSLCEMKINGDKSGNDAKSRLGTPQSGSPLLIIILGGVLVQIWYERGIGLSL